MSKKKIEELRILMAEERKAGMAAVARAKRKIESLETERDAAHSALRTIIDNHDKLTSADCADIARGVLGGGE